MREEVDTGATMERDGGGPRTSIDLKWSIWTQDLGVWQDYAPKTLELIREFVRGDASETGDTLVVLSAPRKEIRSGEVTFTPLREFEKFEVLVSFRSEWDDLDQLLDTLGLEEEDADGLNEALPHTEDGIGTEVEASRQFKYGTRLGTVLKWIDDQEAELLATDARLWDEIEEAYKKS